MLNTPVLFIIFNRPDYTKKVFAQIRKVKPTQLFIAADGPRASHPNDVKLCLQTRKIIEKIDWDCDVKTLFRDENLGCAKGVSGAITWFFEHVEEGIILEDDCVPDLTFFTFCENMLVKYKNIDIILSVTGTNYFHGLYDKEPNGYYFSAKSSIWGWATWRRAWQLYSLEISDIKRLESILHSRIRNVDYKNMLLDMYEKVSQNKIDTWDVSWNYCFHLHEGLCVTPNVNLIKNIGFFGHHYNGFFSNGFKMKTKPFVFGNEKFLENFVIDFEKDSLMFHNILNRKIGTPKNFYNKFYSLYSRFFNNAKL
jgi:hypothetical protein